ncbi:MAG TPA: histidine kinase N-terminal 7TM domain-containing protein [Syntrophomonadaceae bacterium]|nr:histidine kinase N-terminal 7TM domain-containing protein [Syntrophomonadaceae bacterium]
MDAGFANCIKHSRIVIGLFAILIAAIFTSGFTKEPNSNLVICNQDDHALYAKVVEQILPSFNINQSENKPYYILNDGGIAEAFDTQAVGAIETGIAKYWYPQYLATVIIAVDRDQTDIVVTSWSDLFAVQEEVAFYNTPVNDQMLTAAMSYGLEGENYTLTETIRLLSSIHDNKLLKTNSFESPIIICFDYQAAALIEEGRNLEIIIPTEGTYTYEKGLLSNEQLTFAGNVDNLLFSANLPLLDGQSYLPIYPDKSAYAPAVKVSDYKHFATTTQSASCLIEREVLNSKKFMSIDSREHLYSALIYIIIITIWVTAIIRRSMQKGVVYAAFFTGAILNGWVLVRLIKYQLVVSPILSRYLWYSYYIFFLSLPLVLLWMAWAIDKPEDEIVPPKWWKSMGVLIGALIIFVFTNDLHGFVFHLDLSRADWDINYGYGFGYYMVLFVCMMNLLAVFFILIQKSIRNPRKRGFIFPLAVFLTFGIYNYKYIVRDPFVYQTDLTIITGIFTMLMFESCIRSGLIPVNTKYIDLFRRSPLKMQIINKRREVAIASALATPIDKEMIEKVIASSPVPLLQEDESLLFANPIPGGYALWNEDVSKIQQLHREIKESLQMLTEANAMLAEEEKLKRYINEENAKKQLMDQLEAEIAANTEQLSTMIENLPYAEDRSRETTRIALLLCYLKRRCNLFFSEKETSTTTVDKLIAYIDELSEIVKYSNVEIATVNEIKGSLAIRHATLFYDFFYVIADLAVQTGCPYIIEYLASEAESITMRLLPSEDMGIVKLEPRLIAAIAAVNGNIVQKDLEDTVGFSISFPKGGIAYD